MGRPIILGVGPQNKYSLAMYFSSHILDGQLLVAKLVKKAQLTKLNIGILIYLIILHLIYIEYIKI